MIATADIRVAILSLARRPNQLLVAALPAPSAYLIEHQGLCKCRRHQSARSPVVECRTDEILGAPKILDLVGRLIAMLPCPFCPSDREAE